MAKRKGGIWTALDSFEGDKVVAMIQYAAKLIEKMYDDSDEGGSSHQK